MGSNKVTAEDCYQIYHHAKTFAQKGVHPRLIIKWAPIKARPNWVYFEKLADMLYRSAGRIDPKEYIEAVVNHFPLSVNPKLLTTPKGIKVYKSAQKRAANEGTDEFKIDTIKNSIRFIVTYCNDNNLNSFRDYFHERSDIYPTLVAHMESYRISPYFVHLIPNLKDRILSYPSDVRHDTFTDKFWSENSIFLIAANHSSELKKLKNNIEQVVNTLITKAKDI